MRAVPFACLLVLAFLCGTAAAQKQASCYTTDDGEYDCSFVATDDAGSFDISAPGKPSFSLVIEEPGVAFGYADYGTGNVALPGRYLRSDSDAACWVNDETSAEICAW